jgi:S-adenosylmethionine decarboxylase
MHTGTEWVIDARGCVAVALQSPALLKALFDAICADLELRPLAPAIWHVFPGHGGITGLVLLSESHLTIHTYPELGVAAINLYCCRQAPLEWPWELRLQEHLGAGAVEVRRFPRG